MAVSFNSLSQTINASFKNTPLEKVVKELKSQSGYNFIYTRSQLTQALPVNCELKNATLTEALTICLKGQALDFLIEDKYVVLKPKTNSTTNEILFNLSGKVLNEKGEPVIGATIIKKGASQAVMTDNEGVFELEKIAVNDILIVTSVGYQKVEFAVKGNFFINVVLKIFISQLDQTIVIGYGTTSKRYTTGSISKITAAEISKQPVANVLSAIQGRATGVFVQTQNGLPGGNIKIQIRGQGSVAAGTDPLYIIDGVPFISFPLNGGSTANGANGSISPFAIINPSDIESIEILKDADATAIYGSRASNGVVLITTKKGTLDKTGFAVNVYTGIGEVSRYTNYLNLPQYLQIRKEAFQNAGVAPTPDYAPDLLVWDTTKSTDWQKYIFGGTARITNVQADLSAGNKNIRYLFGLNHRDEGSILPGDNIYRRNGAHLSIDQVTPDNKFSASIKFIYNRDENQVIYDASAASFANLPPNFPLYDPEGKLYWGLGYNPAALLLRTAQSKTSNLIANANFRYTLVKDLNIKLSAGYTTTTLKQISIFPKAAINPDYGAISEAIFADNSSESFIIEPQIEFTKKTGFGNIVLLAGTTYQQNVAQGESVVGTNYSDENLLQNLGAAGLLYGQSNSFIQYRYTSLFGRLSYKLKEKYLLSVNVRRDGSSRFSADKGFGNFGAIGTAWIFSNEKWLKDNSFLSFGKIRSSYGITGNDQIADYGYLASYGTGNTYQATAGLRPLRLANPDYSWETTRKLEVAVELGFIKDRVMITSAFYYNRSGNQLVPYPVASQTGFNDYQANLPAEVLNKGFEFELNSSNMSNKNFAWKTSINFTLPTNRLLKYPGLAQSSFANTYVVGQDLSIIKRIHFIRVNSSTGVALFEDINKDNNLTFPEDYKVAGKTSPDFYGGFNNIFSYKGLELSLLFQFVKQHSLGVFPYPGSAIGNNFVKAFDRWQKPGDVTNIPIPVEASNTAAYNASLQINNSDFSFFNTSYIRLKNIQLCYYLSPAVCKKLALQNCSFYIQSQNLLTLSGKSFIDPETLNGVNPAMPVIRQFDLGINVNF